MKKVLTLVFIIFLLTIGVVLSETVTIEAKKQTIKADMNKGFFEGDVKVQVGDIKVQSPRAELDLEPSSKKPSLATFFDNPYAYQEKGNKKHEIKADIIKVSLIKKSVLAEGKSQSIMLENREPVLTVTADSQEYDTNTKIMKAHNGVVIKNKDLETYSDEAMAKVENGGEVKHLELIGHVNIKNEENIIKGNKFTYEPSRDEFQISGNADSDLTFDDGTKIRVTSKYQQLNKRTRTVIAGGNVKVLYQDYVAVGPKAQLLSDSKTNKPSVVIFTGRSKITQNGSSVEADKIRMTINPKAFYADGNVKTTLTGDSDKEMGLMQ